MMQYIPLLQNTIDFISNNPSHITVLKACSDLLINHQDLLPSSTLDSFDPILPPDLSEVHLNHSEARRQAKVLVIAKYLLESPKNFISNKAVISSSTHRSPLHNKPNSKLRTKNGSLLQQLKVEKNLKIVKIERENRMKELERKVYSKSCRNEAKISNHKKSMFAERDKRIQEILLKKYKDIDEHEKNALEWNDDKEAKSRTMSESFYRKKKKFKKLEISEDGENIKKTLDEINSRLDRSAERARLVLRQKAQSGTALIQKGKIVEMNKSHIESEQVDRNIKKVFKIKKDWLESANRKEKRLEEEKKRIEYKTKEAELKLINEKAKHEQTFYNKQKLIEENALIKSQKSKELREKIEAFTQRSFAKSRMKKRNQQLNIEKIQKQKSYVRTKMIQKQNLYNAQNLS